MAIPLIHKFTDNPDINVSVLLVNVKTINN